MTLLASLIALLALPAPAFDAAGAIDFASLQLAATASSLSPQLSPSTTAPDGIWITEANTNLVGWTQGFFPGANWYLYDLTGDPVAKLRADRWTRALEAQKTNTSTHDLGFKLFLSFGHAYRSTGDPYYKDVLLTAAASLASRYDPAVGAIICCDWNPAWHRPVVVDTMVNLELLAWGAQNGGPQSWRDMAISHALRNLADLVRPDGSSYHVVDYAADGTVLWRGTLQGYSDASTWTRGQAWAIYGYTMLYRYTSDPRMLGAARKVTDFYLKRLGADPVPNWDFDAPSLHKDSSAAAAVASALFELSGFVAAPDQQRYLQAANGMLDALASSQYLAKGKTSQAILLHGVGNLPEGRAVDVGLTYGDYYFLEAIARRPAMVVVPPVDGGVADAGPADAGPADAGDPGFADAGAVDGGVPTPADGGVSDSGSGAAPDGGAANVPAAPPGSGSRPGGGCASGGGARFPALALLAFALLWNRRRRARLSRESLAREFLRSQMLGG